MTYRAAIIGAGSLARRSEGGFEGYAIGHAHADAYANNPETTLVAVADVVADNARTLAAKYGGETYPDYRLMLAEQHPDIVSVCTWPPLHREMTIAAFEAGARMVLCEKPMGVGLRDVEAMCAAAEAAGARLYVNHQRRYEQPFAGVRELVDAGEIGEVLRLEGWVGDGWDLMSWGTHWVDMHRYFAADADAEWVLAAAPASGRTRSGHLIEDQMLMQTRFREGPLSLIHLGGHITYAGLIVVGSAATIRLDGDGVTVHAAAGVDPAGLAARMKVSATENGFVKAVADMIACYQSGAPCRIDGVNGAKATEIMMAAYLSARDGKVIGLPVADRDFDIVPR